MASAPYPSVLCLRPKSDFDKVGTQLPETLNITFAPADGPDLGKQIAGSRALVIPAVGPRLAPELFEGSPVELVQVTGAGVDRLERSAMERLKIPVANVPGGSNAAVAEYVVSTALVLLRKLTWASDEIREGRYEQCRKQLATELPPGLGGLTVGIVGLGTIGLAVAQAFRQLGSHILYHDPGLTDAAPAKELDAEAAELSDLLSWSDIVSLHIPLLAETRNLIDAEALAGMKPSAVLINASRGGVVDEAALVSALHEDRLAAAAVDVYAEEPPDSDNALVAGAAALKDRLLLTPHIAGVSRQAWANLFDLAWQNVEAVVTNGGPPRFRVY